MPSSLASRTAADSLRDPRPSFERLRALLPVEELSASAAVDGEPALHQAFGWGSLEELARGLHRQRKGQVLLTGDRGVGRTTLVRRLAAAAAQGRFPGLAHRRFVRLDVANVGPEDSRACLETIFASLADLASLADRGDLVLCLDGLAALIPRPNGGSNKPLLRTLFQRPGGRDGALPEEPSDPQDHRRLCRETTGCVIL
jgi:hypothetical protein